MEIFNIIMGVLGGIISLLMVVIGYFLRQQIGVINALTKSVQALTTAMAVMRNKTENSVLNCGYKHSVIDKRLDSHGNSIRHIEEDVAILKTKCDKL